MPRFSDKAVEAEAVSFIRSIVAWMGCLDHDRATWRVGTTSSPENRLALLEGTQVGHALCGWRGDSAKRAAEELAKHHGMELEGIPDDRDNCIFVYTDRKPTREERARRKKEPLTLKAESGLPGDQKAHR
ncbi:MAG: hypothetical protein OXH52_00700 [Gammaproteobacteria bacterium]|nr:hypothetical protein [Gammaproteobacteria bacterium]